MSTRISKPLKTLALLPLALIGLVGTTGHAATLVAAPDATPTGCVAAHPSTWPAGEPGQEFLCTYTEAGLTRTGFLYQPASATPGRPMPMVVVLHGCTEQGPDIAYISHYDKEAEKGSFLVLYPNQAAYTMTGTTSFDGNGSNCWNWFLPQAQSRGAGEPALIAGLTNLAADRWHVDRSRIFVIGISAGGAMADIMAATYPDIYAAVAILAGCEYRGLPCLGTPAVIPPQVSGQLAYQAAAGHSRVVPFLIENGDADPAVPVGNAFEIAAQWQFTDDYAAHGGSQSTAVPSAPCSSSANVSVGVPNTSKTPPTVQSSYTIFQYAPLGGTCAAPFSAGELGQLYVVHGELHAWSGGADFTTGEPYTNPGGPDITALSYRFFMAHPCELRGGVCAATSRSGLNRGATTQHPGFRI